ncbi:MAG: cadmium-translocating P-type ATPase [Bacilli bacterium]|nr:cadmium-translocating P-type ATPase [Bacilli bacterium]
MSKKIYHIHGFDCPNCASHAEAHLNKHEKIDSAVIDFNNEKLFITYKDEELSIEEIINIIAEVEEDEIVIEEETKRVKEKKPLLTKESIILIIRIILIVILMVTAKILESTILEPKSWIVITIYCVALAIGIYDVLFHVFNNIIHKNNPVDEHLLMSISCIGAFCIAFFPNREETVFFDGVMVLALFQIGELIEEILSEKSKNAIRKAIDLRAHTANLIVDDEIKVVNPESLSIGDIIVIKTGEIVPVDGIIESGSGSLDTSSLTGESVPVDVNEGHHVLSGSILTSGSIKVRVEKTFENSTVSKIMELIENSGEKKSKVDKFITRFARVYTPIVLLIGVLYTLIYGFVTGDFSTALYGGVLILIIGCPCAIVISVPLAFFAGIGLASKNGIIIKGASHLDQLSQAGTLFIDKTGTLTYGKFEVSKCSSKVDQKTFNHYLYVAEYLSNHPIARAIVAYANDKYSDEKQGLYEEITGKGTYSVYDNHQIYIGNANYLIENGIAIDEVDEVGTIIHLAVDQKYYGYVVLKDMVKLSTKNTIQRLKEAGLHIVLLSGDNERIVEDVAYSVGINECHGKLLPQEKTEYVNNAIQNRNKNKQVLFAGDGINDTPSIILADVGIAMGGVGSDVAISNADVVIMNDDPLKIVHSINIAKKTRRVAITNIIIAITIKLVAMVLTMLSAYISFPPHVIPLIDALSDTGLTVLLIFNSLLLIYRKIK